MPKDNDGKMLTEAQRTLEELVWEEKGKLFSNRRGMVGLPFPRTRESRVSLSLAGRQTAPFAVDYTADHKDAGR